jgi:hypothetical protein
MLKVRTKKMLNHRCIVEKNVITSLTGLRQKETEHQDYQSMIKRRQNTHTINDQKETEQKDYQ